jgi:hypothetical protein
MLLCHSTILLTRRLFTFGMLGILEVGYSCSNCWLPAGRAKRVTVDVACHTVASAGDCRVVHSAMSPGGWGVLLLLYLNFEEAASLEPVGPLA